MSLSYPAPPDVRVIDPDAGPVIDSVQAVTGGDTPYCRRCGATDTIHTPVLAGLVAEFPEHVCHIDVPVEPRFITGALPAPFV